MNHDVRSKGQMSVLSKVNPSPFIQMGEIIQKYPNALRLNSATAQISPPESIKYAITSLKKGGSRDYGAILGSLGLREVITRKLMNFNKIHVSPENVVITLGAQEAFFLACMAILKPGDLVVMVSPTYPNHPSVVNLLGGQVVFLPLKETSNWDFDYSYFSDIWSKAERKFEKKIKALVLCNPLNPTGSVLSEKTLRQIAEFVVNKNAWIITDEVYEYYYFDGGVHFSIGQLSEISNKVISTFSLSKTFALPELRIGYLAAPKNLIPVLEAIHENMVIHVPESTQHIAVAALSASDDWCYQRSREISDRRNLMIGALSKTKNLSLSISPLAGLCCFPKNQSKYSTIELLDILARDAGVIGMPGSGFGPTGEQHIRLSFGVPNNILIEAINRIVYWDKAFG